MAVGRKSTLKLAEERIIERFDQNQHQVFRYSELIKIVNEYGEEWGLAQYIRENPWRFIAHFRDLKLLQEHKISFPSDNVRIFTWRNVHPFSIAQAIDRRGFLTHYSAMAIHELTEQVPKTIYFKTEKLSRQDADWVQESRESMTQLAIDRAFKRKPRTSNRFAIWEDWKIYHLAGSQTRGRGIEAITISNSSAMVKTTTLERTLIDIVTRPWYAGGVSEVLKAYRLAKGRVSLNKLRKMLNDLHLVYPYHQTIGFYLEKAGVYSESQLALFESIPMTYDFYLDYQMKDPAYSQRWKLYYPSFL